MVQNVTAINNKNNVSWEFVIVVEQLVWGIEEWKREWKLAESCEGESI